MPSQTGFMNEASVRIIVETYTRTNIVDKHISGYFQLAKKYDDIFHFDYMIRMEFCLVRIIKRKVIKRKTITTIIFISNIKSITQTAVSLNVRTHTHIHTPMFLFVVSILLYRTEYDGVYYFSIGIFPSYLNICSELVWDLHEFRKKF